MPEPKHLLHNLKWRLEALEVAMDNMKFLMQQIRQEIEAATKEQPQ